MEVRDDLLEELRRRAREIRCDLVRMLAAAGSGHSGGSLSAVEIVTVLYWHVLRIRPEEPAWPDRDRFVLSKGHAAPVLYAALAERGFFPAEELQTLRKLGSRLQGHPDLRNVPGVEASTGSLGQGLSVGLGMALAGRLPALLPGVRAVGGRRVRRGPGLGGGHGSRSLPRRQPDGDYRQ